MPLERVHHQLRVRRCYHADPAGPLRFTGPCGQPAQVGQGEGDRAVLRVRRIHRIGEPERLGRGDGLLPFSGPHWVVVFDGAPALAHTGEFGVDLADVNGHGVDLPQWLTAVSPPLRCSSVT